jgi:hypothetical protein
MRRLGLMMLFVAAIHVVASAQETTGSAAMRHPRQPPARAPREIQLGLKFYW